ncbi:MAG: hypothetical protein OXH00_09350 [Candidatus Poribacteria bacterium]|nr:hypothetical protein [Candidatus Poribacteria bacterium]
MARTIAQLHHFVLLDTAFALFWAVISGYFTKDKAAWYYPDWHVICY